MEEALAEMIYATADIILSYLLHHKRDNAKDKNCGGNDRHMGGRNDGLGTYINIYADNIVINYFGGDREMLILPPKENEVAGA